MSLFWSKFPISETKKYNNQMKTCKYKHKIISPFSSRHLGWIPLLMWTIKLCITTSFTISILFSPTPALNVVFRFVYFYFAFSFSRVFLVSSWSKALDIFPHSHTHTYGQFGALSQAPTQPPPQTICLIFFVFSNELDVKFNTHTHSLICKRNIALNFSFLNFSTRNRESC